MIWKGCSSPATTPSSLAPRGTEDIEMLAVGIQTGELVFTEFFLQSALYPDTQWFEIYNATRGTGNERTLNLNGCGVVADNESMDIEIDLFVEAGDYIVLGNSSDVSANQGACIDHTYLPDEDEEMGFLISAQEQTVYLLCEGGREIDSIPFHPTYFPFENNKSIEVR